MKNISKENTIKISSNLEDFCANENLKSNTLNTQGQVRDYQEVSCKNKANTSDSALKMFANNFMSLFGYGKSSNSEEQNALKNKDSSMKTKKQNFSALSSIDENTENRKINNNDLEKNKLFERKFEENKGSIKLNNISFEKSLRSSGTFVGTKESKITETSENNSGYLSSNKKKMYHLPIIAHISGKPIRAKYSIDNKRKIKVTQAVNEIAVDLSKSNENKIISSSNFNSVLVPSPSLQFRQLPVTVSNCQPIIYNTPLIPQRVIPQTNNGLYQPVYIQNQVDMNKNMLGFVGGHIRQRTLYSQDHYSSFYSQTGKESTNTCSSVKNSMNVHVGILNGQNLGFGTPLIAYRSMSHVPNQQVILKANSVNQLESDIEIPEINQETRLQSSNEVLMNSSGHSRSITETDSAMGLNNITTGSNLSLGSEIPINTRTKKEGSNCSRKNISITRSNAVKIENSNGQALSLTTTSSSDHGSATVSNKNRRDKNLPVKSVQVTMNSIRAANSNLEEKFPRENCSGSSNGFIPQASPVVNYRSTLDYLVTPMVRYRDIGSNLKVRIVPPQLSSNDSCKFDSKDAPVKDNFDGNLGSNSPRNMSILDSNEYKETVYTPVAPLPVFAQINGGINVTVAPLDGTGVTGSSNGLVISGTPSLNQFPIFHVSAPVNKPGNSQLGRVDGNLNLINHQNATYKGIKLSSNSQNSGYKLVKSTVRTNFGNQEIARNVSYKENNFVYENKNQNLRKVYVNKMYQLLADSSQFPPLPKEISVEEIDFLMRPKMNSDQNKTNSNINYREDETNVGLVKRAKLIKGMEWDNINRGTFCTVYKAKHGDDIVAVKCPQKKIHESDPLMSRYRCYIEWKLLYRCNRHPNILNLIGGIRINEYEIWLVTEYIKTGDLFKLIHGNSNRSKVFRDSVEYRFKIMYQLADSIRFLHSLTPKIVHKDLKSNNILIDENYNIRICDFGDAEELHYNVITCCTAVTWQYAPPEIVGCNDPAKPNSNATEKVDVWSMGCIFLEILSKKTPLQHILDNIDDSSKHSTLYNLIHTNKIEHELKIPPLPDSLYNLITMCLRPNPEIRATSTEVFEYLINNEAKIMKQLGYINQYKMNNVKF